jgi:hypothetical protein
MKNLSYLELNFNPQTPTQRKRENKEEPMELVQYLGDEKEKYEPPTFET